MLELLYGSMGDEFLAKIAVELERVLARRAENGTPGRTTARVLAQGDGWTVTDMLCTSGPQDRSFEERHSGVSIAIVAAGSFQYRASSPHGKATDCELMTPGSLLLGNPGQSFECGHEHGTGDRCLSFHYAPDYFERIAADAGMRGDKPDFRMLRLPPLRALSPVIARACAGLTEPGNGARRMMRWEEIGVRMAALTVQLANGLSGERNNAPPSSLARVTRVVRWIERDPNHGLTLGSLARIAGLSPYHFLRTFERLTGLTPHQYILRVRLRCAAMRLTKEPTKILDIALDSGFGDVSNFNRAFRAEFGVSPRIYREAGSFPGDRSSA
ncbi:MAG TPA: AraC family transcriptional regulator [Acidobacteriaceae bacterium]|jgi:AraC-like DNA-binding protein|nr:AraC family transcriptional regulator [Acidobacteriaceae bacterium]